MQQIIRSEVSEIRFGLYTDDETKQLSCCKVTSPVAFDGLGNPLSRSHSILFKYKTIIYLSYCSGLYDPRMGPISQHVGPCKTCDLIYMNCPGHPGHIELCVPV
jgi:DNA-directed RNA polymerase I subunit RPA1